MKRILVTGCLGFIGSYFCKYMLNKYKDISIIGFNRKSDERNELRIKDIRDTIVNKRFHMIYGDLTDFSATSGLLENIDYAVHFAAKTFVDHSIQDAYPFIQSNIIGTYNLLEQARKYKPNKVIIVSTDEVYGAILDGSYNEDSRLNPTNPYSAAKAAGDMLAVAYYNTYKVPIIITRTENNYGEYQHPQKVFPVFVKKALADELLPVYGDGKHKRMWLYVKDHCTAIDLLLEKGQTGEIYHIAGEQELENIELAKWVLRLLGKPESQIEFIDDYNIRPGHDRRYSLSCDKIKKLGWKAEIDIPEGFEKTVNWYRDNEWWLL